MNFTKYSNQILLILITILTSLLFWGVFALNIPQLLGFGHVSMETIFANYDGPNYLIISKCGYDKNCIGTHFSLPQPLEYYPAHLPGYPLLIRFLNNFVSGPWAMLLATLSGSILLSLAAFELFKLFVKEKKAFWLTILLLFFPARLFILRQIGAPETWFISLSLFSVLFFTKKNYLPAAIMAALAQAFKSPGIILLATYGFLGLIEIFKTKNIKIVFQKYFAFILVPIVVFLIFLNYQSQTGDFLAYFHSGDNLHLNPLPYEVFISTKSWINTIWLEDIIYIFLFCFIGIYLLYKKYSFRLITLYPLLFTFASVLVAHRDISRYIAPVYPFIILAFSRYLNRKPFKLIFFLLLPAIILYAINFVVGNIAPVADWTPYL
jgi:hypothetical protein